MECGSPPCVCDYVCVCRFKVVCYDVEDASGFLVVVNKEYHANSSLISIRF